MVLFSSFPSSAGDARSCFFFFFLSFSAVIAASISFSFDFFDFFPFSVLSSEEGGR
jgi:hypothetical protein